MSRTTFKALDKEQEVQCMEYKRVIQEFPNGTNINLIPILTPEEEEKRHQRLNDAAVRLLLAQEKKDKEKQMKVAT